MSLLYDKRTKKAMKWVWVVIAILISLSMIFAFSGGIGI
jgi:predicted nucleic acid-binding Zn ribbon protein